LDKIGGKDSPMIDEKGIWKMEKDIPITQSPEIYISTFAVYHFCKSNKIADYCNTSDAMRTVSVVRAERYQNLLFEVIAILLNHHRIL
jgi:hypothetical protein